MIIEIAYWWENNRRRGQWKHELAFDSNGNLIRQISYWDWANDVWTATSKSERTYDGNNRTMQINYRWINNVWTEQWKSERIYDGNGNLTTLIFYIWENNAWQKSWKDESMFDNNGNETMRITYDWKNNVWQEYSKIESAFDSNGNRIMRANYQWENNAWRGVGRKTEFVLDLSVPMSDIFMFDDFSHWITFTGIANNLFFNNKIISRINYEWTNNTWQEVAVFTFHYSQIPTNIPNITENSFTIFPNPVFDNFTISGITENTFLQITDLNGRIVLQKMVSPNEQISVGHLSAGIYFVRMNGETAKIVKR